MPDHLRVFVDESGDPGPGGEGRSTRWLVFAGVAAIGADDDLRHFATELRWTVMQQPGRAGPLHFSKLSGAKKLPAFMRLAAAPMQVIVAAADTTNAAEAPGLQDPQNQYRFALKYVIERASWLAEMQQRPLELVIEQSAHVSIESVREYVARLRRNPHSGRFGRWKWVDESRIRMAGKDDQPQLWLADGAAHAFFQALEDDPIAGEPVPIYADLLQPLLWPGADGRGIQWNGFTFIPTQRTGDFVQEFPWIKRWIVEQEQVTGALRQQNQSGGAD